MSDPLVTAVEFVWTWWILASLASPPSDSEGVNFTVAMLPGFVWGASLALLWSVS